MFCDECRSLLKIRKRRGINETYCPRCSQASRSSSDRRDHANHMDKMAPKRSFSQIKKENTSFAVAPVLTKNHGKHPTIPYFPHPTVREGQSQFIKDAGMAIKVKKHLLANAPTGIGKTAAALVPAISESLKSGKVVFFLTSKQSQHHIAVETLKIIGSIYNVKIKVVDIISKQAMCPRDIAQEFHAAFTLLCRTSQKNGSCSYFKNTSEDLVDNIHSSILHVEELKEAAIGEHVCPHKVALKAAADANVIVCDYNYIFDPDIRETILESFDRSLDECIVIVDEAHNLPGRIRNYYTQNLTANMLSEAISEVKSQQTSHILNMMKRELSRLLDEVEPGQEKLTGSEVFLSRIEAGLGQSFFEAMDLDSLIKQLRKLGEMRMIKGQSSQATAVADFLDGYRQDMDGLIRIISQKDGSKLSLRLLDPSVISAPIFAEFHSSIIMSGTLFPTNMFADILGVGDNDRILRTYPSPFPPENRPVYVAGDVTTLYKERSEAMYDRIARHIGRACKIIPGNAAVFFPSYGMLKEVRFRIDTDKEVIAESQTSNKAQKRRVLDTLTDLKDGWGGLLLGVMGGSLSEGIDYKDNLLDAVIIVGVPFAPPSLEQSQLIDYYDRKFGHGKGRDYGYNSPAINRVLQSMGRCIRSETDRAVIILLDKRFSYSNYRKYMPEDQKLRRMDNVDEELREFFGKEW